MFNEWGDYGSDISSMQFQMPAGGQGGNFQQQSAVVNLAPSFAQAFARPQIQQEDPRLRQIAALIPQWEAMHQQQQRQQAPQQMGFSSYSTNPEPTYGQKAGALKEISNQRAQRADDQGMWLQGELNRNIAKQWDHWGGLNGGHGGFQVAPQIGQDKHDWQGFFDREGVPNGANSEYINAFTAGAEPRNHYEFLGHGAQSGAMGMGDPSGGGPAGGYTPTGRDRQDQAWQRQVDQHFGDPNRPSAASRDWYGDPRARHMPLNQLPALSQAWAPGVPGGNQKSFNEINRGEVPRYQSQPQNDLRQQQDPYGKLTPQEMQEMARANEDMRKRLRQDPRLGQNDPIEPMRATAGYWSGPDGMGY